MTESRQSPGTLVSAHLQRVEVALLARVLATTLAAALPPGMIEVERVRSAVDVLRRRPGQAIGVTVRSGTTELSFRAPDVGNTEAAVRHVVRGIVLSTKTVTIAEWLTGLGALLDERAASDVEAAQALHRFIADRT